jgi:hypothetical protein
MRSAKGGVEIAIGLQNMREDGEWFDQSTYTGSIVE